MSLLTLVQEVCDLIGYPRPGAVADSVSPDARQFLALANREVQTLARRHTWQRLVKEFTFAAVAAEEQPGAIASDLAFLVNETFWNRTRQRVVRGPLSEAEWQMQKATTAQIFFDQFRFRGQAILLMPVPSAGDTYAYEYVSVDCVQSGGGTPKAEFTADDDAALLPERLVKLGVVWRWKSSKGLDYAEDFRTYEIEVVEALARDGARMTLSFAGGRPRYGVAVPEGNWMT